MSDEAEMVTITEDDVMRDADLNPDEFEWLYDHVLEAVRMHGTNGVEVMLKYVEQELLEYREHIE